MGLFTNPLGYAGYPPGASAPATVVNSTVRAATAQEAADGTLTDVYISPATALDFASPPVLGFGSTTPRPVHATTLDSTGNTALLTSATATNFQVGNVTNTSPRTTTFFGGNPAVADNFSIFSGNPSAGTQQLNVFTGDPTGGNQFVSFFSGDASGGNQSFSVMTGSRAGSVTMGTNAAHLITIGGDTARVGFFGAAPAVNQTQASLTNNVTSGGTSNTIANFTDLSTYATDAPTIRNDIYQLAATLANVITGLRNYGLFI